jgi:hypothetical protein
LNKIKADFQKNEMIISEQTLTISEILHEKHSLSIFVENLIQVKVDIFLFYS